MREYSPDFPEDEPDPYDTDYEDFFAYEYEANPLNQEDEREEEQYEEEDKVPDHATAQSVSIEWMGQAACASIPEWTAFPSTPDAVEQAKAVCQECAVRMPCLEYARATRQAGLWGGLTELERNYEPGISVVSRPTPGPEGKYLRRRGKAQFALVPERPELQNLVATLGQSVQNVLWPTIEGQSRDAIAKALGITPVRVSRLLAIAAETLGHSSLAVTDRDRLTPVQNQALNLYDQGYTVTQIAEMLNVAPDTITQRLVRARKKLGIKAPKPSRWGRRKE